MEQNLYDMWIWTSAGIFDMVLAEGGVSMKKTTREQCEEVIAARVEWLVTRWQEDKTQEEKKADHKLNERMDHWMKEITKEQRLSLIHILFQSYPYADYAGGVVYRSAIAVVFRIYACFCCCTCSKFPKCEGPES